jgi:hypothetical protein
MSARSDREVNRIVARERPGYHRVQRAHPAQVAKARPADAGTPDLPALHATVERLRLWDLPPRGARRGAAPVAEQPVRPPARPSAPSKARSPTSASHQIVTMGHASRHESDPLETRVVVVSRSQNRIIGEQG